MLEDELVIGDIIFFKNHYKTEEPYSYIDHVAMYAGNNGQGHPTLIHNISSQKGHYHPEKSSGLCITTLRALQNQLQQEDGFDDVHYDVEFLVFRNKKDPSISTKAVELLMGQARYKIPYDEKRLQNKLDLEAEGLDGPEFKKLGEEAYRKTGIYRSMKYAARLPLPLVRTRLDGVGRGLTCSMSVVLAYQIIELIEKELIQSITSSKVRNIWVSDKYAPRESELDYSTEYKKYLTDIRKESSREEPETVSSYACWTGKDNKGTAITPETFCHEFFPVDAKLIGAEGLYLHMKEQDATWVDMGSLDVIERNFTDREKNDDKARRRTEYQSSLENLAIFVREGRSSVFSASPSPRPPSSSSCERASPPTLLAAAWFFQKPETPRAVRAVKESATFSSESPSPSGEFSSWGDFDKRDCRA